VPKKAWLFLAWGWTITVAVLCLISFEKLPGEKIANADKFVHATFHLIFVLLWSGYFRILGLREKRLLLAALMFSIFYGCLIEIAQHYFTITRQADITDVVANFCGAALAVGLQITARSIAKRTKE
jgi:glycopeptide antibiotics resistance protein